VQLLTQQEERRLSVTTITKDSLPADTRLIYATPVSSPVFEITFCQTSIPDDQVISLASSLSRLLALSPHLSLSYYITI
jgi:hypothetical protein